MTVLTHRLDSLSVGEQIPKKPPTENGERFLSIFGFDSREDVNTLRRYAGPEVDETDMQWLMSIQALMAPTHSSTQNRLKRKAAEIQICRFSFLYFYYLISADMCTTIYIFHLTKTHKHSASVRLGNPNLSAQSDPLRFSTNQVSSFTREYEAC